MNPNFENPSIFIFGGLGGENFWGIFWSTGWSFQNSIYTSYLITRFGYFRPQIKICGWAYKVAHNI